jgi:DNA-binding NarL/FixJ family response regulator
MDRKKILIIEDESIIAMNVQNLLEQKGYEVIGPAIDGKEAINMALAHI